jgi:hypothetical protein
MSAIRNVGIASVIIGVGLARQLVSRAARPLVCGRLLDGWPADVYPLLVS